MLSVRTVGQKEQKMFRKRLVSISILIIVKVKEVCHVEWLRRAKIYLRGIKLSVYSGSEPSSISRYLHNNILSFNFLY